MKKDYRLFVVMLCYSLVAGCIKSPTNNPVSVRRLKILLSNQDYFKLDAQFKLLQDSMDDGNRLYFKCYIDNAFNRNADCVKDVDSILQHPPDKMADSVKVDLLRLQSDSYFKNYQYAKSAASDSSILKKYRKGLSKDEADDISNDLLLRNALKNTPEQQTTIKSNTTITWKKDGLGLMNIPIGTNSKTFDAVFDTRANISSITESYARKLGLRRLNVSYFESSGITGNRFKTGLGIANSMYIGSILVKNAVFQIMPDSILYISVLKVQLNLILGFPVIEQLQEIHIFNDGRMTIPLTPTHSDLHNFALNGLDPVIALRSGKDTLPFNFDSGATSSVFYFAYFQKYKANILKCGVKKTVGFAGAGGIVKKEAYKLPTVTLALGDKQVRIDSVVVQMKKISPGEKLYGNIGQDFTKNFKELVYNFKDMYVKVE
jgi:predicted aspartyl protease